MTNWFDELECPVCGTDECVPANGPRNTGIIIIGAYPGDDEINEAMPMVGNMGTKVLAPELRYLGLSLDSVRKTNLWLHKPNKNERCLQHGLKKCIEEAADKDFVLLLGALPCEVFLKHRVTDINGLVMQSPLLSAKVVVPCLNPAYVWNRDATVGELRFALRNFVEALYEKEH